MLAAPLLASVSAQNCPVREPLRARAHRSAEVDLLWIARRLGLLHLRPRAIVAKVRLLAGQRLHPFPLPKNPRFVKGERQQGAASIDARSLWDRDTVERWFEDDLPPVESAALVQVRRSAVAEEMTRRALQLVA